MQTTDRSWRRKIHGGRANTPTTAHEHAQRIAPQAPQIPAKPMPKRFTNFLSGSSTSNLRESPSFTTDQWLEHSLAAKSGYLDTEQLAQALVAFILRNPFTPLPLPMNRSVIEIITALGEERRKNFELESKLQSAGLSHKVQIKTKTERRTHPRARSQDLPEGFDFDLVKAAKPSGPKSHREPPRSPPLDPTDVPREPPDSHCIVTEFIETTNKQASAAKSGSRQAIWKKSANTDRLISRKLSKIGGQAQTFDVGTPPSKTPIPKAFVEVTDSTKGSSRGSAASGKSSTRRRRGVALGLKVSGHARSRPESPGDLPLDVNRSEASVTDEDECAKNGSSLQAAAHSTVKDVQGRLRASRSQSAKSNEGSSNFPAFYEPHLADIFKNRLVDNSWSDGRPLLAQSSESMRPFSFADGDDQLQASPMVLTSKTGDSGSLHNVATENHQTRSPIPNVSRAKANQWRTSIGRSSYGSRIPSPITPIDRRSNSSRARSSSSLNTVIQRSPQQLQGPATQGSCF